MPDRLDLPTIALLDIHGVPTDKAQEFVVASVAWNCSAVARQSAYAAGVIPEIHNTIMLGIAIMAADLIQFMTKNGEEDVLKRFNLAVKDAVDRKLTARKVLLDSGLTELVEQAVDDSNSNGKRNGKAWL